MLLIDVIHTLDWIGMSIEECLVCDLITPSSVLDVSKPRMSLIEDNTVLQFNIQFFTSLRGIDIRIEVLRVKMGERQKPLTHRVRSPTQVLDQRVSLRKLCRASASLTVRVRVAVGIEY